MPKLFTALALALGLATAATAAAYNNAKPVVVWDHDFGTETKGGYTITLGNGNTVQSDGSILIGQDATVGVKIAGDNVNIYTVVIKASGYAPTSSTTTEVIAAMLNGDNCYVGLGARSDKKCYGIWNNGTYSSANPAYSQAVIPDTESHTYTVSYKYGATDQITQGTRIYVDGTLMKSDTGWRGSSLGAATTVSVGGPQGSQNLAMAKGLKIEGIAIFSDTFLAADTAATYKFPSDTDDIYSSLDDFSYAKGIYVTCGTGELAANNTRFYTHIDETTKKPTAMYIANNMNYPANTVPNSTAAGLAWPIWGYSSAASAQHYAKPGSVMVFPKGTGTTIGGTFGPLTIGGIYVPSGATGYSLAQGGHDGRTSIIGDPDGSATLFRFDEDFAINRQGTFYTVGVVTFEVASSKTLTLQSSYSGFQPEVKGTITEQPSPSGIKAADGGTLVLKGEGKVAVTTLTAKNGASLDYSNLAADRASAYINGTLAIDDSTVIKLPAGLATNTAFPMATTLSGANNGPRKIWIGDKQVTKSVTFESGKIKYDDISNFSAETTGGNFSDITWTPDPGGSFTSSALLTLTNTATATVTFDQQVTAGELTVVNDSGKPLTLAGISNATVSAYDFTDAAGGVKIDCSGLTASEQTILTATITGYDNVSGANEPSGYKVYATATGLYLYKTDTGSRVNPVTGASADFGKIFVGSSDGQWANQANWRTLTTVGGDKILTPYTDLGMSKSPAMTSHGGGFWRVLLDGANAVEKNVTCSETLEGWLVEYALLNGIHATVSLVKMRRDAKDFTSRGFFWVDETSSLTISSVGGTRNLPMDFSVASQNGLTFSSEWNANVAFDYYFKGLGSVNYAAGVTAGTHTIKQFQLVMGSGDNKIIKRQPLVSFASSSTATFTVDSSATVSADDSTAVTKLNAAPTLSNDFGAYFVSQESDGVYVTFVGRTEKTVLTWDNTNKKWMNGSAEATPDSNSILVMAAGDEITFGSAVTPYRVDMPLRGTVALTDPSNLTVAALTIPSDATLELRDNVAMSGIASFVGGGTIKLNKAASDFDGIPSSTQLANFTGKLLVVNGRLVIRSAYSNTAFALEAAEAGTIYVTTAITIANNITASGSGWGSSGLEVAPLRAEQGATLSGSVTLNGCPKLAIYDNNLTISGALTASEGFTQIASFNTAKLICVNPQNYSVGGTVTFSQGTLNYGYVANNAQGDPNATYKFGDTLVMASGTTLYLQLGNQGAIDNSNSKKYNITSTVELAGATVNSLDGGYQFAELSVTGNSTYSPTWDKEHIFHKLTGSANITLQGGSAAYTINAGTYSGTITYSAGNRLKAVGTALTAATVNMNSSTIELTADNVVGLLKMGTTSCLKNNVATLASGTTLDVNGRMDSDFAVTLNGGKLTNSGTSLGTDHKCMSSLALTADSEIDLSKDWGLIGNGHAATTLALDTHTLTKKGSGIFYLISTTISGTGTFVIEAGNVNLAAKGTSNCTCAEGTIEIGANGKLSIDSGKSLSLHGLTVNGGTIANGGSITNIAVLKGTVDFTDTTKFQGGGTYAFANAVTVASDTTTLSTAAATALAAKTVTVASGATLDFAQTRPTCTVDKDSAGSLIFKLADAQVADWNANNPIKFVTINATEAGTPTATIVVKMPDGSVSDGTPAIVQDDDVFKIQVTRTGIPSSDFPITAAVNGTAADISYVDWTKADGTAYTGGFNGVDLTAGMVILTNADSTLDEVTVAVTENQLNFNTFKTVNPNSNCLYLWDMFVEYGEEARDYWGTFAATTLDDSESAGPTKYLANLSVGKVTAGADTILAGAGTIGTLTVNAGKKATLGEGMTATTYNVASGATLRWEGERTNDYSVVDGVTNSYANGNFYITDTTARDDDVLAHVGVGDTLSIGGVTTSADKDAIAWNIINEGGSVTFTTNTPTSSTWLGRNGRYYRQTAGTMTAETTVDSMDTADGQYVGFMLNYQGGQTFTFDVSGGTVNIPYAVFNYGANNTADVSLSGDAVMTVKGIRKAKSGTTVGGTFTMSGNAKLNLGSCGIAANAATFTLNGGTLVATDDATVSATLAVPGDVTFAAASGKTLTIGAALTGEGDITIGTAEDTGVVKFTNAVTGRTLTFAGGMLDVAGTTSTDVTFTGDGTITNTAATAASVNGVRVLANGSVTVEDGKIQLPEASGEITATVEDVTVDFSEIVWTDAQGASVKIGSAANVSLATLTNNATVVMDASAPLTKLGTNLTIGGTGNITVSSASDPTWTWQSGKSGWTGTYVVNGTDDAANAHDVWNLYKWYNGTYSKVQLNCSKSGYFYNDSKEYGELEIAEGKTVTINDAFSDKTQKFTKLSGSGAFCCDNLVCDKNCTQQIWFDDVDEFSGTLKLVKNTASGKSNGFRMMLGATSGDADQHKICISDTVTLMAGARLIADSSGIVNVLSGAVLKVNDPAFTASPLTVNGGTLDLSAMDAKSAWLTPGATTFASSSSIIVPELAALEAGTYTVLGSGAGNTFTKDNITFKCGTTALTGHSVSVSGTAATLTTIGSRMYFNRLSGSAEVPVGTYGAITLPSPAKATAYTTYTTLDNNLSTEETTGDYGGIIGKPYSYFNVVTHTVAGWFKVTVPAEGESIIWAALEGSTSTETHRGYAVKVTSEGKIKVGKVDKDYGWTSGASLVTFDTALQSDTWYHLALAGTRVDEGNYGAIKPVLFVNGAAATVAEGEWFNCNVNSKPCMEFGIGAGVSAAGIYITPIAISDAASVVKIATSRQYVNMPFVWIGQNGGSWNEATNWSLGEVPTSGAWVSFPLNAGEDAYTVALGDSANVSLSSLAITGTAGSFGFTGAGTVAADDFSCAANLTIPEGVTMQLKGKGLKDKLASGKKVSGAGTIVMVGEGTSGTALRLNYAKLSGLTEAAWMGTVELKDWNGATEGWDAEFNGIANSGSKIRFNGFSGYALTTATCTHSAKEFVIGENGAAFVGAFSTGDIAFAGKFSGSGNITIGTTGAGTVKFIGDVTDYTGTIGFADGATFRGAILNSSETTLPTVDSKTMVIGTGVTAGAWTVNANCVLMDGVCFNSTKVPTFGQDLTLGSTAVVAIQSYGDKILNKAGLTVGEIYGTALSGTVGGEALASNARLQSTEDGIVVRLFDTITWKGGSGAITNANWNGGTYAEKAAGGIVAFPANEASETITVPDGTTAAMSVDVSGTYVFKGEGNGSVWSVGALSAADEADITIDALTLDVQSLNVPAQDIKLINGAHLIATNATMTLAAAETLTMEAGTRYTLGLTPTFNATSTIKVSNAAALKEGTNYKLIEWMGWSNPDLLSYGKPQLDITGYAGETSRVRLVPQVYDVTLQVMSEAQTNRKPLVIMPIGDSITEGLNNKDGSGKNYRIPLFNKLSLAGYNVKSVGYWKQSGTTKSSNVQGSYDPSGTVITNADWIYHCGKGSMRAGAMGSSNATVHDSWANDIDLAGKPDAVLLHIGINDMLNNGAANNDTDGTKTYKYLTNIIVRAVNGYPATTFVISSPMCCEYGHTNQKAEYEGDGKADYNKNFCTPLHTMMTNFYAKARAGEIDGLTQAAAQKIYFADLYQNVMPRWYGCQDDTFLNDGSDCCHPNWLGHEKMAQTWFDQITNAFPNVENTSGNYTSTPAEVPEIQKGAAANVPSEYLKGFVKVRVWQPTATDRRTPGQALTYTWTNEDVADNATIEKVAYFFEYVRPTATENLHRWVWTDMDAFGDDTTVADVGVPTTKKTQQVVNNLHVYGNHPAVWNVARATGGVQGFIEFSPYSTAPVASGVSGAPANWFGYDWNDTLYGSGAYGCMQVHRILATQDINRPAQVVFAYNGFTTTDSATYPGYEFGIGNFAQSFSGPTGMDWTDLRKTETMTSTNLSYRSIEIWVKLAETEARIGGKHYSTLEAALDAAEDGATVTLTSDAELSETYALSKNIVLAADTFELSGAGFSGTGTLTVSNGFISVTSLGTCSLIGGKYKSNETAAASGYYYAPLSQGTGYDDYAYQILKGSATTDEKVYPVSTDGADTGYVGDLAFTKAELVTKKVISSDSATDAEVKEALNTKQANTLRGWENAVLGLDGTVETSKPVIQPKQTTSTSHITFQLGNVNVSTKSGATVTYKVKSGTTLGTWNEETTSVSHTETQSMTLPESGVKYYTIEVITTPAK